MQQVSGVIKLRLAITARRKKRKKLWDITAIQYYSYQAVEMDLIMFYNGRHSLFLGIS